MSGAEMEDENELAGILADQVNRLLADTATREVKRAAELGDWPAALWAGVEEAGLPLALVSEDAGGVGAGWAEAEVVMRAAGRHQAPLPLVETMLAARMLEGAGLPIPDGPMTLAPIPPGDALTLDGERLSGRASRVPWGGRAGHVVLLLEGEGGTAIVLAEPGEPVANANVAREPRDDLTWTEAVVQAAPTNLSAGDLRHWGAFARAAQMAGALEFVLAESVRYANDRSQFGRPLGKFQAVQQQLAALAGEVAAAGASVLAAARALDRGRAGFEVACAKIRCGEAAGKAAAIAHQVHGAIGFTQEHALHFATKRLWSWRAEFGGEAQWSQELGREMARLGADRLWPFMTGARGA